MPLSGRLRQPEEALHIVKTRRTYDERHAGRDGVSARPGGVCCGGHGPIMQGTGPKRQGQSRGGALGGRRRGGGGEVGWRRQGDFGALLGVGGALAGSRRGAPGELGGRGAGSRPWLSLRQVIEFVSDIFTVSRRDRRDCGVRAGEDCGAGNFGTGHGRHIYIMQRFADKVNLQSIPATRRVSGARRPGKAAAPPLFTFIRLVSAISLAISASIFRCRSLFAVRVVRPARGAHGPRQEGFGAVMARR